MVIFIVKRKVYNYISCIFLFWGIQVNHIYAIHTIDLKDKTSVQLSKNTLEYGVSESLMDRPTAYSDLPRQFIIVEDPAKTYWARVRVVNNSIQDKEWYLVAYNYNMSSFDFFIEDKTGMLQTIHYSYPSSKLSENSVLNHSPTYRLFLPRQDTAILYLRIQHPNVAQFGFEIVEQTYFFNAKIIQYILLGLFYGALIILVIYHLLFYAQLKESFYGWYSVFILFQVLYLSFRDGTVLTLFLMIIRMFP
jgi:hypothetical protein